MNKRGLHESWFWKLRWPRCRDYICPGPLCSFITQQKDRWSHKRQKRNRTEYLLPKFKALLIVAVTTLHLWPRRLQLGPYLSTLSHWCWQSKWVWKGKNIQPITVSLVVNVWMLCVKLLLMSPKYLEHASPSLTGIKQTDVEPHVALSLHDWGT